MEPRNAWNTWAQFLKPGWQAKYPVSYSVLPHARAVTMMAGNLKSGSLKVVVPEAHK